VVRSAVNPYIRLLAAFLVFGLIGVAWIGSWQWVSFRQARAIEEQSRAEQQRRQIDQAVMDARRRAPHDVVWMATHVMSEGSVTLILFVANPRQGITESEVLPLVTAPDGKIYTGGGARASEVTSLTLHQQFPGWFHNSPRNLLPGTYQVQWIITSDGRDVIAGDSFDIPQKAK
jgi:hypothetical protein